MINFQRPDAQKALRDTFNIKVNCVFSGVIVRVPSRVSIWQRGFGGGAVKPSSYYNPFDFEPSVWKKITDPTTAYVFKFGSGGSYGNIKTINQLNDSKDFKNMGFRIEMTDNPEYAVIQYVGKK